jgi:hypothetical protein
MVVCARIFVKYNDSQFGSYKRVNGVDNLGLGTRRCIVFVKGGTVLNYRNIY